MNEAPIENESHNQLDVFHTSKELNLLFEALCKFQGELKPARLDKKNPHFKNEYASLESCAEAYRELMGKYGLLMLQPPFTLNGDHYLRTIIGHISGQFISSSLKLSVDKGNMQSIGSAITYARRYAGSSLINLVDSEDDDGEINRKAIDDCPPPAARPPRPTPIKNHAPAAEGPDIDEALGKKLTPQKIKLHELMNLMGEKRISADDIREIIIQVIGEPRLSTELSTVEIDRLIDYIKKFKK